MGTYYVVEWCDYVQGVYPELGGALVDWREWKMAQRLTAAEVAELSVYITEWTGAKRGRTFAVDVNESGFGLAAKEII